TTPLSAAMTVVPSGAAMLMPSLLRPPFFGPKFEMILPFTGHRKRSLPRGAGSGSGGMAAISVCFGAVVFGGGSCGAAGAPASGVVGSSIGAVVSGVEGAVADCVAGCCFGGCCFGACGVVVGGNSSTDVDPPVLALGAVGALNDGCCCGGISARLASMRPGSVNRWPGFRA